MPTSPERRQTSADRERSRGRGAFRAGAEAAAPRGDAKRNAAAGQAQAFAKDARHDRSRLRTKRHANAKSRANVRTRAARSLRRVLISCDGQRQQREDSRRKRGKLGSGQRCGRDRVPWFERRRPADCDRERARFREGRRPGPSAPAWSGSRSPSHAPGSRRSEASCACGDTSLARASSTTASWCSVPTIPTMVIGGRVVPVPPI